jgi:hypothetical protein
MFRLGCTQPFFLALICTYQQQAYQLGQRIRTTYGDVRSPTYIQGLGLDPYVPAQVIVRSDEGGDPSLNYESTLALSQGLWLPSSKSISYLANGTAVKAPMNGYQVCLFQFVMSFSSLNIPLGSMFQVSINISLFSPGGILISIQSNPSIQSGMFHSMAGRLVQFVF